MSPSVKPEIRIHPSAVFALFFPLFGLLTPAQTAVLWICAILHECGHIAAWIRCGAGLKTIELLPFGISAQPMRPICLTPTAEILCALCGPAVNALIAAALLASPLPESDGIRYLLHCNLSLFAINLLPILPLDGGRIVYFSLAKHCDAEICEKICARCAKIVLILLTYPALAQFFVRKNPSPITILIYLFLQTVFRRGAI